MAEKNFMIGESIEVTYQAGNGESGLVINMQVVKPDKTFVPGGPVALTEIANSGRYYGSFVPSIEGEWSVQAERADGTGKMTKAFSVGTSNVKHIATTLELVAGKLDDQDTNLGVVHTKVDDIKTNTGKIPSIEADIAQIKQSLHSPVMIA
jgi:hypothetical protein